MRHFGHGVGHLQYELPQEIEPGDTDTGMAVNNNDASDLSDNHDLGDSDEPDPEEPDSDEEEGSLVVDEEGEGDASDTISNSDGSDSDGYASY